MDTKHLSELGIRAHAMVGTFVDIYYELDKEQWEGIAKITSIISTNEKEQTAVGRVEFPDGEKATRKFNVISTVEHGEYNAKN